MQFTFACHTNASVCMCMCIEGIARAAMWAPRSFHYKTKCIVSKHGTLYGINSSVVKSNLGSTLY